MSTKQSPTARGIMFHHFHDKTHAPGQGSISAEQFGEIIDHLGVNNFLPAQEWFTRAKTGRLKAHDLCITFDDGLRCQYDIALPVLKSKGLDAFWFVYTSVIEGRREKLEIYRHFRNTQFASIEQFYECFFEGFNSSALADDARVKDFNPRTYLAEFSFYTDGDRRFRFLRDRILGPTAYGKIMEEMIASTNYDIESVAQNLWLTSKNLQQLESLGHVVGLHSHSHPTLISAMSAAEQEQEYTANWTCLNGILKQAPLTMSHPCNSYSTETLAILRGLGIEIGFCSNMAPVANRSLLEFPRQDHADLMKFL